MVSEKTISALQNEKPAVLWLIYNPLNLKKNIENSFKIEINKLDKSSVEYAKLKG